MRAQKKRYDSSDNFNKILSKWEGKLFGFMTVIEAFLIFLLYNEISLNN